MITWMQTHNKFLIWTIWVATISFIGTGAVVGISGGGSKAGSVAKVGEIEIKQSSLNMAYSNLYGQYNEMMKGNFDDEKAKEMGLIQQAFARLETQAQVLNFALEVGIIVSDKEVAEKLQEIPLFQKDNQFNKANYTQYLLSQQLKAKVFEKRLRDELTIKKTMALLNTSLLPLEKEAITASMTISDKIAYYILTPKDINFTTKEVDVKQFWENKKENYRTEKKYTLSILWTSTNKAVVSDKEIKDFYQVNSFNYMNQEGKQLSFDDAKSQVIIDLKLKKTKKTAQKAYIAYKKGKVTATEKITLSLGEAKLVPSLWKVLETKSIGDIIKPKINVNQYATIKIEDIILPKIKTYKSAKKQATFEYERDAKREALLTLAQKEVSSFDINKAITSDFIKFEEKITLKGLEKQESLQFAKKFFTSYREKGMISIEPKIVIFNILEQKFVHADENQTKLIKQTIETLKINTFQSNLLKVLSKKYQTEVYQGGLKN